MGERLLCKQEVIGSIPFTSTNPARPGPGLEDDGIPWRRWCADITSFGPDASGPGDGGAIRRKLFVIVNRNVSSLRPDTAASAARARTKA